MRRLWICMVLIGCCSFAPMRLQAGDKVDHQAAKDRISALNFVKMVNTAEREFLQLHGRYATFPELTKSGQGKQNTQAASQDVRGLQSMDLQSQSEPLAGFHLRFIIASDGSEYELSLTETSRACGFTWFSNESGALYQAKTLTCAEELTPSAFSGGTDASRCRRNHPGYPH